MEASASSDMRSSKNGSGESHAGAAALKVACEGGEMGGGGGGKGMAWGGWLTTNFHIKATTTIRRL